MATFSLGAIAGGALSFALGGAIIGLVARYGGAVLPLIGPVQPWQLVFRQRLREVEQRRAHNLHFLPKGATPEAEPPTEE